MTLNSVFDSNDYTFNVWAHRFELGFEQREGADVTHQSERAPDLGSRAAESSAPQGAEAAGGHSEVDGGRRSEGAG